MPTAQYTALANITLGSAAASVTFSSINGTYRDLMLVVDGSSTATSNFLWRANSDSGNNYSYLQMVGVSSGAVSNSTSPYSAGICGSSYTEKSVNITQWLDYSATDKHKTSLGRANSGSSEAGATASRWANTAAITSLYIYPLNGAFAAGSTFALYGVK